MQNDKEILEAMDRKTGWLQEVGSQLAKSNRDGKSQTTNAIIQEAFLRTVSRFPTPEEIERLREASPRFGITLFKDWPALP